MDVPTSLPTSRSTRFDIPSYQLKEFNDRLKHHSCVESWPRLASDGNTLKVPKWQNLGSQVLFHLSRELASVDARLIKPVTILEANKLVKTFDDDEFEQWNDGVRRGLEEDEWESLIAHSKLLLLKPRLKISEVEIEKQNATVEAWNLEYRGESYKGMLRAVDGMRILPAQDYYAKVLPVVQSSGTGKSRSVDMVATKRIVLPLCIREFLDPYSFAYPASDSPIRDHLLSAPSTTKEIECRAYFDSFLNSLFQSALLQAEGFFPTTRAKVSYACMAKTFHDFFSYELKRFDFYKTMIAGVLPVYKVSAAEPWRSFRLFVDRLKQSCFDWPDACCPILVSVDDAEFLCTRRFCDPEWATNMYSLFVSVLNGGYNEDICFITLSTDITISELDPLMGVGSRHHNRRLFPVFTELPFDVFINSEPLVRGQADLTTVGSMEFTAKFGRPLFYGRYLTYFDAGGGMMQIIRTKLSGRTWPPDSPAVLDASSIAILSARLCLDLSPATPGAQQYEKKLIRSHLRLLYSVPRNEQAIITGSSPEPLIAEAAAEMMGSTIGFPPREQPYMDVWDLVAKFVREGLSVEASIGTLIGRVLSISAMDHAINTQLHRCQLQYQTPVSVVAYYKALFTDEAWESIRRSTPANHARLGEESASKPFEDAFADAYFHFSHYAKAIDATPMQDDYAWALWLRGSAILCQEKLHNQDLPNRAMPIFFSSRHTVSPKSMSMAFDHDYTGQSGDPSLAMVQSAENIGFFSEGNKLPYITAVHCYAQTQNEGVNTATSRTHPERDDEAPRYQISVRGLVGYRNVNVLIGDHIRWMVDYSTNAIFLNHRRKESCSLLRQMLPVLNGHPDAQAWIGNSGDAEKSMEG